MAGKNNTGIIVILIIMAILLGVKFGVFDFIITGSETMNRNYPSIVDAGSSVQVTYSVSGASGNWAASVIDNLANCKDKNGNLIPIELPGGWSGKIEKKFVIVSTEGTTVTQTYQIPDYEGMICTFSGNYKFGDKPIKSFSTQTIQTRIVTPICNSGADSNNDGIIDRSELGEYMTKWVNGQTTRTKLGEVIMEWVDGC